MSPRVIVLSIGMFVAFLLLQICLRRIYRLRSEDIYVLTHWILGPVPVFAMLPFVEGLGLFGSQVGLSYLLFLAIAAGWVASYPAIYAASPTLIMAWMIRENAGLREGRGTSYEELCQMLDLKRNSTDRIADACKEGLVRIDNGRVSVTPFGKLLYRFFHVYRKFLGLELDTV